MKYNEFRKIMSKCKNVVEVHEDDFKILCNFIIINDIFTLHDISRINLVNKDCLWFNEHRINLEDIETIHIHEVRSYLK